MNVLFSNFWFRYIFFYILEHYIIFLILCYNKNHFYPNIYILTIYNITLNYKSLTKFKNNLLIFDLILVITNIVLSTFIACTYSQMPLQDAIASI